MGSAFWATLSAEMDHHSRATIAATVALGVLVILRAALPRARRPKVRFAVVCLLFYLVSLPARALLGLDGDNIEGVALGASILLGFGLIAFAAVLLFDLFGHAFQKLRILRTVASSVAGVLVVLSLLRDAGVNLSSIVTTSAVLTGVIGFAMQETLGNVIAGIAMQLESTVSIGDWVTVGDVSGQVTEIRWRSISIVNRNDDMVIIPNGALAKATIINLSRPVPWHRQWVHFYVHYRHPPNEVQRLVLDAMRGVPNVKPDAPAPDCILYRVEQDHAHYAVRYRLLDLRSDDGTDAEVRKRIWYAFRRHGIEIPYPSRNVFMTELSKEREDAKWQLEHKRRITALQKVAIFKPLEADQLDHLAERLRVEEFGVGETILRQGEAGDSLYMIRRGTVSVRVSVDRVEREVASLGEGQLFGEMSLMTGAVRSATVVAKTDAECYVIDRALFQEVIGQRPTLVHEISQILSTRQVELQGEVAQAGAEAARTRASRTDDLLGRIRDFFGLGGLGGPGGSGGN